MGVEGDVSAPNDMPLIGKGLMNTIIKAVFLFYQISLEVLHSYFKKVTYSRSTVTIPDK